MASFDSDELLRRFTERTIGADAEIPITRIVQAPIPAGVKAYLRAHLRERLRDELGRNESFSRVRTLSPSAARLEHLFIEHAADAYVYGREAFQADLENAVHFTENYVCRPRWTLTSFLFHTKDAIPVEELFAKLEYVTDYVYLPQLLRRTLGAREMKEIDRAACTELIRKIDAAVVHEHAPRELAALAHPLFDFFGTCDPGGNQEIPVRPILLFFEDKELDSLKDYISGISHFRNRECITPDELAAMCDDFMTGGKDVPPANEIVDLPADATVAAVPAGDDQAGEELPAEVAALVAVDGGNGVATVSEQPLDQETPAATSPVVQGAPGEPGRELFISDPGMDVQALAFVPEKLAPAVPGEESEEQLELPLEPPPPVQLPDLTHIITPEQRKRFIAILCDRDADFYDLVIARLNEMRGWHDAAGYVRELFEINSIDPFRDEAIEFTDIVQQRFAMGTGPTT
jgi:hypothetical protein